MHKISAPCDDMQFIAAPPPRSHGCGDLPASKADYGVLALPSSVWRFVHQAECGRCSAWALRLLWYPSADGLRDRQHCVSRWYDSEFPTLKRFVHLMIECHRESLHFPNHARSLDFWHHDGVVERAADDSCR